MVKPLSERSGHLSCTSPGSLTPPPHTPLDTPSHPQTHSATPGDLFLHAEAVTLGNKLFFFFHSLVLHLKKCCKDVDPTITTQILNPALWCGHGPRSSTPELILVQCYEVNYRPFIFSRFPTHGPFLFHDRGIVRYTCKPSTWKLHLGR